MVTAVTLSGADTATPSFTAPAGPATLTFELEVCDQEPLCDTDTVVIKRQRTGAARGVQERREGVQGGARPRPGSVQGEVRHQQERSERVRELRRLPFEQASRREAAGSVQQGSLSR